MSLLLQHGNNNSNDNRDKYNPKRPYSRLPLTHAESVSPFPHLVHLAILPPTKEEFNLFTSARHKSVANDRVALKKLTTNQM